MVFFLNTERSHGFTLIELLVFIAVTSILLSLSIIGFKSFSERTKQASVNQTILGALKEAQAKTLASLEDTTYGVHFETTSVTIFEGAAYDASDVTNVVRVLPAQTNITSISLLDGGTSVVFSRLTGKASTSGTITLTVTTDVTINSTVTIHQTGLAEITG